ncbi:MAG: prolyl oligopeptidase family serine peptidase [Haliea sp.]|nr:prolyl oligopeptidase family serine peptidase [Haliea sp.]
MNEVLPGAKKVSYRARDGLEIEAYLTLPKHVVDKPVPAIIFPHGGPMVREYGGFDYWTQFFVHRGYAVLQPNFRGSSGYGHEFQMHAVGQYGMAMQDDLADATHWLIEHGIADPDRICIVGASSGVTPRNSPLQRPRISTSVRSVLRVSLIFSHSGTKQKTTSTKRSRSTSTVETANNFRPIRPSIWWTR